MLFYLVSSWLAALLLPIMSQNFITKLWLDESGDAGFKFNLGSSQHFIIAFVYLETENINEEVSNIEKQLNKLKERLSLTPDYEFKFSRCKDKFKQEFLENI